MGSEVSSLSWIYLYSSYFGYLEHFGKDINMFLLISVAQKKKYLVLCAPDRRHRYIKQRLASGDFFGCQQWPSSPFPGLDTRVSLEWSGWGAEKLMGEDLKVVWSKFSTLR
jgi:hypothetical protein